MNLAVNAALESVRESGSPIEAHRADEQSLSAMEAPWGDEELARLNLICGLGSVPAAALMSRSGLFLQPFRPEDAETLYQWRNEIDQLPLWTCDRKASTREQLRREFCDEASGKIVFLIFMRGRMQPIGMIFAAPTRRPMQQHCSVHSLIAEPEFQMSGCGAVALGLISRFLFGRFCDLRKIALEVYEWNRLSLKSMESATFVRLEGIRPRHAYWNGGYHAVYEFALNRADYLRAVETPTWKRFIG